MNLNWRKSSYSGGEGNCIAVADHDGRVLVADTKDSQGPVLRFTPDAWRRFSDQLKGARSLASNSRPILQGAPSHLRVPLALCSRVIYAHEAAAASTLVLMMLSKRESNSIYEAIVETNLDPAEFDLEDTGKKVVVTHNSGSRFEFSAQTVPETDYLAVLLEGEPATRSVTEYKIKYNVTEGISKTSNARDVHWITIIPFEEWLKEIKLTVGVPDHWAELRRNRRSIAIIQRSDFANTPFDRDEQEQIAAQLLEIKKQVKHQFSLSNKHVERVEESLDELAEASKRMGRKDWLIYSSGQSLH